MTGLTELGRIVSKYSVLQCVSFNECSNLEGIVLPNTLKDIGASAFEKCSKITSITIPDSVTYIGEGAFEGCSKIKTITISSSAAIIGKGAFSGCVALEEITLPFGRRSYSDMGYGAGCFYEADLFGYVFGSNSYVGAVSTSQYYSDRIYNVGRTELKKTHVTYYLPPFLKKVTITGRGGVIANGCFRNCKNLTDLIIGSGVVGIGNNVFEGCTNLSRLTINNGVVSIGDEAFSGCSNLTSIMIPHSVADIGCSAFDGCTGLVNADYNGTLAQWCKIKFSKSDSNPFGITKKFCIQGKEITNLDIPYGVESINSSVFCNCEGVTSVKIPDSVKSIGESAFFGCTGLSSVRIPGNVTKIDASAFSGCSSLTSVFFSDTSGWYCSGNSNYTDGAAIDSATLADPGTAATYLKDAYRGTYWYKL